MNKKIPKSTVTRLSIYLRDLDNLEKEGARYVSSLELSRRLGVSDAQIRRDLWYFGQFGRSGMGYHVGSLKDIIMKLLGINQKRWHVAIIGVGNLGKALASYKGFAERGFEILACLDVDKNKVGRRINGVKIEDINNLRQIIEKRKIKIGIIAAPVSSAQTIADELVKSGIRSIINFAPIKLHAQKGVDIRNVDLSMELEGLSFYLSRSNA